MIRLLYMNLMVITNQISIIDTQKKRKKPKHNTKDSHQITREESKISVRKLKRIQKQLENNQQNGNKYVPIKNYFKL